MNLEYDLVYYMLFDFEIKLNSYIVVCMR